MADSLSTTNNCQNALVVAGEERVNTEEMRWQEGKQANKKSDSVVFPNVSRQSIPRYVFRCNDYF